MNLDNFDTVAQSDLGAEMEVQHPVTGAVITDGNGKALRVRLAGKDSKRYRDAERRITNKRLATQQAGRRAQITSEGLESDGLSRLVAATISWSGIELANGPLECTPDNVREVYTKLPWLREQVEAFVDDRANFLKTPSAS